MESQGTVDPMHQALAEVAGACIDESLLDEAERLLLFLEMTGVSPYISGLLRVWARTQRGNLREGLRDCTELLEVHPDSGDLMALQAVLRFACGERDWRPVCERLLELPHCRPESRQVATSLLDGSFGRKNAVKAAAVEEAGEGTRADPAATAVDFSYAAHFLRG